MIYKTEVTEMSDEENKEDKNYRLNDMSKQLY
jgi:hypothetical protein